MIPSTGATVAIALELHDDLASIARRTRLRDSVRRAADRELQRMGVPAGTTVSMRAGAGERAVRIRVNGTRAAHPPQLLVRAWQASLPREVHDVATTTVAGSPGAWLREAAPILPAGALTKVLSSLVVAVLRRRPDLLLDGSVIDAYVDDLQGVDPQVAGLDVDWVAVLRPLLALTGTLADRSAVAAAVRGAVDMGLSGGDVVESAFARLRPPTLELRWGGTLADDGPELLDRLLHDRGLPSPLLQVEPTAPADRAFIKVLGVPELPFAIVGPDELLVEARHEALTARGLESTPTTHPVTGRPAAILAAADRTAAHDAGFQVLDAPELVLDALAAALLEHRHRLLSISDLEHQLDLLRGPYPAVIRAALATLPLAVLAQIARVLVKDGIALTEFQRVLDRLLDFEATREKADTNGGGSRLPSPEAYAEGIRWGLADLFASWCESDGAVDVLTVDHDLEASLSASRTDLDDDRIRDAAWAACAGRDAAPPVVITSRPARRPLSAILGDELPALIVLSELELPLGVERRVVGTLT